MDALLAILVAVALIAAGGALVVVARRRGRRMDVETEAAFLDDLEAFQRERRVEGAEAAPGGVPIQVAPGTPFDSIAPVLASLGYAEDAMRRLPGEPGEPAAAVFRRDPLVVAYRREGERRTLWVEGPEATRAARVIEDHLPG